MANEGNESFITWIAKNLMMTAAGMLVLFIRDWWRSTRARAGAAEDAQDVTSPRTENHNAMLDALKKSPKFKRK